MPFALLMNPWVILAALVALASTFGYGHHVGWNSRDDQARIEVAQANDKARETEQQLTVKINDQATQLRKAQDDVRKKQSDLNSLAAAGKLRLPASCPAQQAGPGPAASAGDRDQAQSELERQTIEALIAIAADGDRAAQQANACIDAYNQVREKLNGDR